MNRTLKKAYEVNQDVILQDYRIEKSEASSEGGTYFSKNKTTKALASSPDFLQHAYNIYFIVHGAGTNDTSSSIFNVLTSIGDVTRLETIADNAGLLKPDFKAFAARIGTVEVPQVKKETFNMKVLASSIDKARSKLKFEHKSSFTLRADENLVYFQIFNAISNNQENSNIFFDENFSPFTSLRVIEEDLKEKQFRLDIIVKNTNLSNNNSTVTAMIAKNSNSEKKFIGGKKDEYLSYWVFEDVNILGTSTDLEFGNTSFDPMDLTYSFIFKNLYMIDGRNSYTAQTTFLSD